jgi:hypothetical protein
MHHGATSLEVDFIHQTFHQVDAAAMHRLESLCAGWVRELGAAKSRSFVPDNNGNFLIGHAAEVDVNMLAWIFMIAVNDAVCQNFSQGDFNVKFVARNTLALPYEDHELIDEWRNRRDFTSHGLFYLKERAVRVQNVGRRSRLALSAHFFSVLSGRNKARRVPNQRQS